MEVTSVVHRELWGYNHVSLVHTFQVKFKDDSTSIVSEEDVYSSLEKLPKKVKSKIVSLQNAEL